MGGKPQKWKFLQRKLLKDPTYVDEAVKKIGGVQKGSVTEARKALQMGGGKTLTAKMIEALPLDEQLKEIKKLMSGSQAQYFRGDTKVTPFIMAVTQLHTDKEGNSAAHAIVLLDIEEREDGTWFCIFDPWGAGFEEQLRRYKWPPTPNSNWMTAAGWPITGFQSRAQHIKELGYKPRGAYVEAIYEMARGPDLRKIQTLIREAS